MIDIFDVKIPQLTAEKTRRTYVYVPDSFSYDNDLRYPVLYMFDGHNVFYDSHATYGKSWGMKEYMDHSQTQMIIVGVECNDDPNNGRLNEYCPYHVENPFGTIIPKGKIYMDWLVDELKPYIDEKYPTLADRNHTYISGSSMGGLMSLYGLVVYNHVFSKAAALSASLWNMDGITNDIINSQIAENSYIFLNYGEREFSFNEARNRDVVEVIKLLLDKRVFISFSVTKGEGHSEASWEKQVPLFMKELKKEL